MKRKTHSQMAYLPNGRVLASRITVASSFFSRLIGLLGVKYLPSDEGLIITPCSNVHTFGMSISIDIVFLDCHDIVTRECTNVTGRRVLIGPRGTVRTLELAAGVIGNQLKIGDRLRFINNST